MKRILLVAASLATLAGASQALAQAAAGTAPPPAAFPKDGPSPQPSLPRVTARLPGPGGDKALPIPPGPFEPTWDSIRANYRTPEWFQDAKFGVFMHWGLYSVPAHFSEWYPRHMYSNTGGPIQYHREKYGPQDKFGYKDFIPMFTAAKFDPDAWAALFEEAGVKYIVPTAEHHDGFALYDSALTRWDAKDMGPKRDLMGDLAKAVRARGIKFGMSNHRMEHWDFMYPADGLATDLFDPAYADFYGPPQRPSRRAPQPVGEVMTVPTASQSPAFQEEWLARVQEMVDKYQPDIMWFDNGVNSRALDPVKLRFAAYYYNRARQWGKDVSISTKSDAYLAGSIEDFERQGRAPKTQVPFVWEVDDPIMDKFGYVEGLPVASAESIVEKLVMAVSRNGNYLLNISPRADGTIPQEQQDVLRSIGAWLKVNGESIYATRPWIKDTDGAAYFARKGDTLYATMLKWPTAPVVIPSIGTAAGKVSRVTLLGHSGALPFTQDAAGLHVTLPAQETGRYAYALKIEGLRLQ